MPPGLRHHAVIIGVTASILFFRLGGARLWDRDEPRNARCAVEMLERNDWVVPYFNGELRTHKPVLLYWLIMSAYSVFGVNEFAARFWSAALGVGTVVCSYHLGKRLFSPQTGFWAALSLAPAIMFDVAARAATPDGCLIFFVTASLTAFVLLSFPHRELMDDDLVQPIVLPRFPSTFLAAAAIYALVALAVLAKGPVGFVLPMAIMVTTLMVASYVSSPGAWGNRLAAAVRPRAWGHLLWHMRPATALLMLAVIALPWYAWVGIRTDGAFLRGFLWEHNIERATRSMEGHSGSGPIFYPLTLLVGFFPASIFLIPAIYETVQRLRRKDTSSPALLFCLLWVGLFVAIFSIAKTKLPSYVTPCYPALALLVGETLRRWSVGALAISGFWLRSSLVWLAAVGCGVIPIVAIALQRYLPGEEWLCVIGLPLIVAGMLAAIYEIGFKRTKRAIAIAMAGGITFSWLLFGLGPSAADRHQFNAVLFDAIRLRGGSHPVAAWQCLEPSWVFYLGQEISEVPLRSGEKLLVPTPSAIEDVRSYLLDDSQPFVIVRGRDLPLLGSPLPGETSVLAETPLFLKNDTLVLLGPSQITVRIPADQTKIR